MASIMEPGIWVGFAAASFTFAAFVSKNMLSLRILSIVSNVLFVIYGAVESLLPPFILHAVLLPLNAIRLREIIKLSRQVAAATQLSPVSQWLLPQMRKRNCHAGDVLFRKGDPADTLIYVSSGTLRLTEIDKPVVAGDLIGEIGIFSPYRVRTKSLIAQTDCEFYEMTDDMLFRLYYQNPKLGFHIIQLVAERLIGDIKRQEAVAQHG